MANKVTHIRAREGVSSRLQAALEEPYGTQPRASMRAANEQSGIAREASKAAREGRIPHMEAYRMQVRAERLATAVGDHTRAEFHRRIGLEHSQTSQRVNGLSANSFAGDAATKPTRAPAQVRATERVVQDHEARVRAADAAKAPAGWRHPLAGATSREELTSRAHAASRSARAAQTPQEHLVAMRAHEHAMAAMREDGRHGSKEYKAHNKAANAHADRASALHHSQAKATASARPVKRAMAPVKQGPRGGLYTIGPSGAKEYVTGKGPTKGSKR